MIGTNPNAAAIPPAAYGCGDLREFVEYEAYMATCEAREASRERVTDGLSDLPPDLYAVVDGRVVSAKTGQPLPPLREQIARMTYELRRHEYIERRQTDAVTLKPVLDLFSNLKG